MQNGVQSGAYGQCRENIPKKEISKEVREGEVCHCDWQGRCLDAVQVLLGCLPPSASPTSSISSSPISPFDGLPDLIVLYLVPVEPHLLNLVFPWMSKIDASPTPSFCHRKDEI